MPRYIDAVRLEKSIRDYADRKHCNGEDVVFINGILKSLSCVKTAPTADVAEVKRGECIGECKATCSVCGAISSLAYVGVYNNYCPNCGAVMTPKRTEE